ncbi:hypothetical protein [Geodermatophilus sabuli]|uniref:Uncharacterized protein n=1 Tax=Geodermatophilus sabuli TaxID=1564158 RepID=A0A285EH52_9ACTN|nr:hypothetical protein [Geodermatophilus sabuli]MBB3086122.1 hypothetical protein [Geodermatophilus sabuli]SNX98462.1 hypothetical protein SAMN06893097_110246 [Geodermatophilus sabuli]
MSRAALRSTLTLAAVGGLVTTGLLNAAVAGATGPCALSADATTMTCTHADAGGELLFHVPEGVTDVDVAVLAGEAPGADVGRVPVPPGSTLVIDLGTVEELTAATDRETSATHVVSGDGVAARVRVLQGEEPTASEGAGIAVPADVPAGTPAEAARRDADASTVSGSPALAADVPVGTPDEDVDHDGGVAETPGANDASIQIVLTFAAPDPGLPTGRLLEPHRQAETVPATEPEDATEDASDEDDSGTGDSGASASGDTVEADPEPATETSAPAGESAPASNTAPDDAASVDDPAQDAPAEPAAPAPTDEPGPVPSETTAPSETTEPVESPAAGTTESLPAPAVQTPDSAEPAAVLKPPVVAAAPAPVEAAAPVEAVVPIEVPAAAATSSPAEGAPLVESPAPAVTSAPAEVTPPVVEPAAAGDRHVPWNQERRAVPTPSAGTGAQRPAGAVDEQVVVDGLQPAASAVPAGLLDADGVGIIAGSLAGFVGLGLAVTVAVGARRRD